jgi:hypothetical protein
LGDGCVPENHIILLNHYKYIATGFLNKTDGKNYVQLGCVLRTIQEWDADFWNNPNEFKEGTPEGNKRFVVYQKIKKFLEG